MTVALISLVPLFFYFRRDYRARLGHHLPDRDDRLGLNYRASVATSGTGTAGGEAGDCAADRPATVTPRATTAVPTKVAAADARNRPGSPRIGASPPASAVPTTEPRLNVIPE